MNIRDKEDAARKFVQVFRIPYAAGRDATGQLEKLYNVGGTPTTFFIGRDGRILETHEGMMDEPVIASSIERLLKP